MFDDLFSFKKERLPLQALGFYIVFLIICVGISLFGLGFFTSDISSAYAVGTLFSFFYCPFLGYLILSKKKQLNSAYSTLLIISAVLAYLYGALGGLIPVAYLSTLKNL